MPPLPPDSRTPRPQPPAGPPPVEINWRALLWYLPMMLLTLWIWQDLFYQMRVHTIAYSDFKQHVAYHEVGHALVGAHSKHADPVHKISIVPRGRTALGYTLQLPTEQQFLMTRSELVDRLTGLLGGRAAEETIYQEVSTGAENDLERATALARRMICMYGMNEEVGLVHCARRSNRFLPGQDGSLQTDCSPHTAEIIDQQVKQLLDTAYEQAKQILKQHRNQLEHVARELLKRESLDAAAFNRLLTEDEPTHAS